MDAICSVAPPQRVLEGKLVKIQDAEREVKQQAVWRQPFYLAGTLLKLRKETTQKLQKFLEIDWIL